MTSKTPHIMLIMVALIKYEVIMNDATRRDNGRGCFSFILPMQSIAIRRIFRVIHIRFKN